MCILFDTYPDHNLFQVSLSSSFLIWRSLARSYTQWCCLRSIHTTTKDSEIIFSPIKTQIFSRFIPTSPWTVATIETGLSPGLDLMGWAMGRNLKPHVRYNGEIRKPWGGTSLLAIFFGAHLPGWIKPCIKTMIFNQWVCSGHIRYSVLKKSWARE